MILPAVGAGVRSTARNIELLLLAASAGFVLVAWRALDAAGFAMPPGSQRIVTQFLASAALGHLALRLLAPRASAVPYATAMLLAGIGLAFVTRLAPDVAQAQANWITVGVVLMAGSTLVGRYYPFLRRYRYTAAALAFALLVATGLFGTTINGARLWITVGGEEFQTTEVIKILVVLFLAGYLADEGAVLAMPRVRFGGRTYSALPYLVPLILALGGAIGALALLKDLGTIALLLLLAVAVLYVATGRLLFVFGGVVLLAVTVVLGYQAFGHVKTRIDVWLDPHDDPAGSGYQSLQAVYAIQAGGVTGTGLGLGQPEVIPAAPTDYVYSAISEELGLAGATAIVLLYLVFLFAGLRIAEDAGDTYARLLASALAMLIAIQAAVIVAGNLRLIPTTGITLPFVSYGGSSLAVNFILVGLLLGVSQRRRAA
jgi:peptidoglycan glycosyltransferase